MSPDSDAGDEAEMEKINVRLPQPLLTRVDELRRNGDTRTSPSSSAKRSVMPSTPTQLSEEELEYLAERREQREQGETVSQDDVKDRLGIDN
jgi:PHD/YefM family antitoxin component YafN of YafNO toxin-antitoxin module